jgi:hypothetical protein
MRAGFRSDSRCAALWKGFSRGFHIIGVFLYALGQVDGNVCVTVLIVEVVYCS